MGQLHSIFSAQREKVKVLKKLITSLRLGNRKSEFPPQKPDKAPTFGFYKPLIKIKNSHIFVDWITLNTCTTTNYYLKEIPN